MQPNVFWILLAFDVGLSGWCLWRVGRDYRNLGKISASAIWAVWIAYLLHLALTAYATWTSMWQIPIPRPFAVSLGVFLFLIGVIMLFSAIAAFHSLQRMSGVREDQLVDHGIYRYSRHPQNVGWALALLGMSIGGRSGAGLLLTVIFWLAFRLYLPSEEHHLQDVFRVDYERYRWKTPRYLGRPQNSQTDGPERDTAG